MKIAGILTVIFAAAAAAVFLMPNEPDALPTVADSLRDVSDLNIIVRKQRRVLEVYDGERLVKTVPAALGFAPEGDKEIEGDGKTPEGDFYVFGKNPKSKYYLSIGISYPNHEDAERGLAAGLITRAEHDAIVEAIRNKRTPPQKTRLGGEIYIHGGGAETDWTQGCVAIANEEIKELFDAVKIGARVRIEP